MERAKNMIESITQIVQRERHEIGRSSTTLCRTIKKSDREAVELLEKFNPSLQYKCYAHPERCVSGSAPTLAEVNRDYGEQVVVDWLIIELNDYQGFVGVKEENKIKLDVVCELARMMLGRYYFLKLPELMLFFQKLKYGDYGEMYGCVDAVRILRALRSFVFDRSIIIDKLEQEERERKQEEDRKNAISYEEYIERMNKQKMSGL